MKKTIMAVTLTLAASFASAQSFTNLTQQEAVGKSGLGIGYDSANDVVVRSSFGNPPVLDVLSAADLSAVSTVTTTGPTYGGIAGFGMGVCEEDGFIAILDHNEIGDQYENGLVGWDNYQDTTPALITSVPAVDGVLNGALFPRYITILGTGTDRSLITASPNDATEGSSSIQIYRTTDGLTWDVATTVNEYIDADPEPKNYGGQRGTAAYVGDYDNATPQFVYGANSGTGPEAGIIAYEWNGTDAYENRGILTPNSTDSSPSILSIAVDPGTPPTQSGDGVYPVIIALGAHGGTDGSALYMFNAITRVEIAKIPFTAASSGGDVGSYGAVAVDSANDRAYFTIRNGANSTIGFVDYEAPAWPLVTNAENWSLYQ